MTDFNQLHLPSQIHLCITYSLWLHQIGDCWWPLVLDKWSATKIIMCSQWLLLLLWFVFVSGIRNHESMTSQLSSFLSNLLRPFQSPSCSSYIDAKFFAASNVNPDSVPLLLQMDDWISCTFYFACTRQSLDIMQVSKSTHQAVHCCIRLLRLAWWLITEATYQCSYANPASRWVRGLLTMKTRSRFKRLQSV